MPRSFPILAFIAAVILFAGCSGSGSATRSTEETDRLLKQLESSYNATPMLTIEGSMLLSGMPVKVWIDAFVRKRDSLKIILTGPFGVPAGALSATPGTLQFYNPQENAVFEGKPDRETFRKMILVDIGYEEMIALLRGELPRIPEPGAYTSEKTDDGVRFTVREGNVTETFTIDLDDLRVLDYERRRTVGESQVIDMTIEYDRYREFGDRMFPYKATVKIASGTQTIWITVDKVRDGVEDDQNFALDVPNGIERRKI
jgi:hypothetical protein